LALFFQPWFIAKKPDSLLSWFPVCLLFPLHHALNAIDHPPYASLINSTLRTQNPTLLIVYYTTTTAIFQDKSREFGNFLPGASTWGGSPERRTRAHAGPRRPHRVAPTKSD
jgi:hypothetical protein